MAATNRRGFLRGLGVVGCSFAAHPLTTTITLAATPGEARLVVIVLRGGMDGLDVLRPVGDPKLKRLRGGIATSAGIPLDGFYELHPSLEGLMPLWAAGELGFVQAVSTPYRDKRSHFDGQDILEAGTGMDIAVSGRRDGWLNRLLAEMPGSVASTAFAIGRETPLILSGDQEYRSWAPETRLDLSPQSRLLLDLMFRNDPRFQAAASEAMDLAEKLGVGAEIDSYGELMTEMRNAPRQSGIDDIARFAADRLREETRIATFSIQGWDTHSNQSGGLRRALGQLQASLLALRDGLGPVWSQTTVLAMTEFGRTVAENGTRGTDHGTGGLMILAGGAVRGGQVHGHWPGLDEAALYDRRDLMPTDDVRRYAGWALRGGFGVDRGVIERNLFPGLDLGDNPGILA